MFLAINEMKRAKLRYGLILGLLFLIAYLMFFLTALAYGLMQDNRAAIDKWHADTILLKRDSYTTLSLSSFEREEQEKVTGDQVAPLAQMNTVAWSVESPQDKDKKKISLFGVDTESFITPDIVEGRSIQADSEMVIDKSAALKGEFQLGDEIYLSNFEKPLLLVGYTQNDRFSVAPVAYVNSSMFQEIKYGKDSKKLPEMINALVVKGDLKDYPSDQLEAVDIETFIDKLPGYSAQNMTFAFMIGFLIVISAVIIGIFMYILTIQKSPIFGVMKFQGISNATIATAVLSQTFLLSFIGSSLGLFLTWASSYGLPKAVPFMIHWSLYAGIFLAMVCFAMIGSLFSVLAIAKIDPLKALG